MIDNKGRLFGKVNIIDMVIVIFIVALALGGFSRFKEFVPISYQRDVELKIMVRQREQIGIEYINVGDTLKEFDTGVTLGTITAIDIRLAREEIETTDGEIKWAEVPERYDLFIQINARAQFTNNSIMSGNKELRIGNKLVLRTKYYALDSIILEVVPKEE